MPKHKRKHFIPESIKKFIDAIPKNASVIINCGHIDSPEIKADELSISTFENGVEIARYLKETGYKKIRLTILINDMYEFDKNPKEARKALAKRRKEYKKTGVYDLFPEIYKNILKKHNFTGEMWPQLLIQKTESGIKFAAKQAIEKSGYFTKVLIKNEEGIGYQLQGEVVPLTSKIGSPLCRMITGILYHDLEKKGATHIIHLYDIRHECSTRRGILTSRELFGGKSEHLVFFYSKINPKIKIIKQNV